MFESECFFLQGISVCGATYWVCGILYQLCGTRETRHLFRSVEPGLTKIVTLNGLSRCRATMAHTGQSRQYVGTGFQVEVLEPLNNVPALLKSGLREWFDPVCRCSSGYEHRFHQVMETRS